MRIGPSFELACLYLVYPIPARGAVLFVHGWLPPQWFRCCLAPKHSCSIVSPTDQIVTLMTPSLEFWGVRGLTPDTLPPFLHRPPLFSPHSSPAVYKPLRVRA